MAAAVLSLAGCTADATGPPTPPPASVAPVAADAQATVDAALRTARAGDRGGFEQTVSGADPSFGERARLLYDNLHDLPLAEVRLQLQPGRQPLSADRTTLLGPQSWRQQAVLTWRLRGEQDAAEHRVWLTFVAAGGRVLLAGTLDGPTDRVEPQPVWWTGTVRAVTVGSSTLLLGAGQPAGAWRGRVRSAVAEVVPRVGVAAAAGGPGAAVVEVPASRRDFEAVVGAAPGSYADIAAVTLAEGPASTAAVRVVVNPDVSRTLAPAGVAVVLTHELVHVATRSVDSPAPTWAVEGFADDVAFDAHPGAAGGSARPALEQVRRHGPPAALPGNDRFGAGAADLDVAYGQAWLACRYVEVTWSAARLRRFYAALDRGRSLDEAAADELGVSAAALTAGWRSYLRRRAGG